MEQNEILEGNKLIAEFMGIVLIKGFNETTNNHYWYYNNVELEDFEPLPDYHSSWDWLMPVVEKIEIFDDNEYYTEYVSIENCKDYVYGLTEILIQKRVSFNEKREPYKILITYVNSDNGCYVIYSPTIHLKANSKIEAVWLAVVEFIKWYNEQST